MKVDVPAKSVARLTVLMIGVAAANNSYLMVDAERELQARG
jgi:hypothetical protein